MSPYVTLDGSINRRAVIVEIARQARREVDTCASMHRHGFMPAHVEPGQFPVPSFRAAWRTVRKGVWRDACDSLEIEHLRRAARSLPLREQLARSLEFELAKATFGMGMPRDEDRIARLRAAVADARAPVFQQRMMGC